MRYTLPKPYCRVPAGRGLRKTLNFDRKAKLLVSGVLVALKRSYGNLELNCYTKIWKVDMSWIEPLALWHTAICRMSSKFPFNPSLQPLYESLVYKCN